jgi:hypothetical protein
MSYLLAIKKSASSLRGKQSEVSSACSDNSKREAKSSLYARPTYETLLAIKVSFMRSFSLGITDTCKKLCETLLCTKSNCLNAHYFVMICSRKLVRVCEGEMRP